MFLNDLHLFIEQCNSDDYADDARGPTHMQIYQLRLRPKQHDGNNTQLWFKQNKMEYIMIQLHV